MRKLLCISGALVVLAALTITGAASVAAATPATFTLTAGALSISAPVASVSLGTQVASTNAGTISGSLGVVTVTDQRGGTTTWTTSVISTAFTPTAGPADPASNVSYAAGPITVTPTVVATAVAAARSDRSLDGGHGRQHWHQRGELESDHLGIRACELCPGGLRGHHYPLGRLSGHERSCTAAGSPSCLSSAPWSPPQRRAHSPPHLTCRPRSQAASESDSSPSATTAPSNPLANTYIVDRLAPGATLTRSVEIDNDTRADVDVSVYPAAASVVRGSFVFAPGSR